MGSFFWPSSVFVCFSFCKSLLRLSGDCLGELYSSYRFLKRFYSIAKLLLRSSIFLGGKLVVIEPRKLGFITFVGELVPDTLACEFVTFEDLTRLDRWSTFSAISGR